MRLRRGFTLLEVVLILLVVTMGLLGVIGLISYGSNLVSKAQGMSLGMATAVSVANDPGLLGTSNWTYAPLAMDELNVQATGSASGFVNGFYVTYAETSETSDIIAKVPPRVYARRCTVTVNVYEQMKGALIVPFVTEIVRQRGVQ